MDASKLITSFVVVILGVIFIGIISGQVNTIADPASTSQSVSIASARLGLGNGFNTTYPIYLNSDTLTGYSNILTSEGCGGFVQSSFTFLNASGSDITGNFTVTCPTSGYPYVLVANNTYMLTMLSNTTTWGYNYYPRGYLTTSFGKSVVGLIPGMLAIFILLGVIAGVYFYLKGFGSK